MLLKISCLTITRTNKVLINAKLNCYKAYRQAMAQPMCKDVVIIVN